MGWVHNESGLNPLTNNISDMHCCSCALSAANALVGTALAGLLQALSRHLLRPYHRPEPKKERKRESWGEKEGERLKMVVVLPTAPALASLPWLLSPPLVIT